MKKLILTIILASTLFLAGCKSDKPKADVNDQKTPQTQSAQ